MDPAPAPTDPTSPDPEADTAASQSPLSTRGYGHAHSIPLGLTWNQQEELRRRAKQLRINSIYSLMESHYGSHDLRGLRATQFEAAKATIEREGARIAPIWERMEQLAADPEFGLDGGMQRFVAHELARRAGLVGYRIDTGNRWTTEHTVPDLASEIEAKCAGAELAIELRVTEGTPWGTEKTHTETFSEWPALAARLAELIDAAEAALDTSDFSSFEQGTCEAIRSRITAARERLTATPAGSAGQRRSAFEIWLDDEDDDEITLLECTWKGGYPFERPTRSRQW